MRLSSLGIKAGYAPFVAILILAQPAAALGSYPAMLQENFQMGECLPGCGLCHLDPQGGGPRNEWGGNRGSDAARQHELAVFDEDFDGDGVTDREELKQGSNPGNKISTPQTVKGFSICIPAMPTYGCGARVAPAPPRGSATATVAALLAGLVALVAHRRQRRATSSLPRRDSKHHADSPAAPASRT